MSRRSIFRQSALDRLASPEQLDTALGVPARKRWLVLAACASLVAVAVLWWMVGVACAAAASM